MLNSTVKLSEFVKDERFDLKEYLSQLISTSQKIHFFYKDKRL
ncbi:hypothetical protein [Fictibacillus barbaricus]|nr:hypothetical protein [Fictibacillus barbaricus]GGB44517.1 hypothetical protein GCM10007199_07440 [Fictibacillus barbaricus]